MDGRGVFITLLAVMLLTLVALVFSVEVVISWGEGIGLTFGPLAVFILIDWLGGL